MTSPELKGAGHNVVLVVPVRGRAAPGGVLCAAFDAVEDLIGAGVGAGRVDAGLRRHGRGPVQGVRGQPPGHRPWTRTYDRAQLFEPAYGSFVVELRRRGAQLPRWQTGLDDVDVLALHHRGLRARAPPARPISPSCRRPGSARIESVFPYRPPEERAAARRSASTCRGGAATTPGALATPAGPRVVIPVFPGNNCEYDSAPPSSAPAPCPRVVVNNLTPEAVAESTAELARRIRESQIVMMPGGFSGGDEPDGSAKFITAFFRAPEVTEAVRDLLQARDGLMLGICNGFQALVKLGLVPYGDIRPMDADCATLTFNTIGRHQSRLVRTRVASTCRPGCPQCEVGEMHTVAISHGEGRFVAPQALLDQLMANGQVATQYVDAAGAAVHGLGREPQRVVLAIEGITSPDGRVLGKMGHTERAARACTRTCPATSTSPCSKAE